MAHIIGKSLNLRLNKTSLLQDIDFDIAPGESMILLGESGSGKTILAQLLVGKKPQNAVVEGTLTFNGTSLLSYDERKWKDLRGGKIAYIAQNPHGLFNELQTIESHGVETLRGSLSISEQEAKGRFKNALTQFHLNDVDELVKKYPFELSGGMLQRVMIAMMMELKPHLLIADEPTSSLDAMNSLRVVEMLHLCKRKGTQLLLITHDYALLKDLGEKILVLRKGKALAFGSRQQVLDQSRSPYEKALLSKREYLRYLKP